jgi:hypothetical protein
LETNNRQEHLGLSTPSSTHPHLHPNHGPRQKKVEEEEGRRRRRRRREGEEEEEKRKFCLSLEESFVFSRLCPTTLKSSTRPMTYFCLDQFLEKRGEFRTPSKKHFLRGKDVAARENIVFFSRFGPFSVNFETCDGSGIFVHSFSKVLTSSTRPAYQRTLLKLLRAQSHFPLSRRHRHTYTRTHTHTHTHTLTHTHISYDVLRSSLQLTELLKRDVGLTTTRCSP